MSALKVKNGMSLPRVTLHISLNICRNKLKACQDFRNLERSDPLISFEVKILTAMEKVPVLFDHLDALDSAQFSREDLKKIHVHKILTEGKTLETKLSICKIIPNTCLSDFANINSKKNPYFT